MASANPRAISMPPAALFEAGLDAVLSSNLLDLDKLVRELLKHATHDLDMGASASADTPPSSASGSSSVSGDVSLNQMGDYLSRTAMLWAYLTDNLLKGPHLEQATFRAHERSRTDSGMSDLSEVARLDVDITRLRKIRDLSLEFSRQVQSTWRPQTPVMGSPSGMPPRPASISPFCDARLSAVSSGSGKTVAVPTDGDSRAFKARKLLPDSHAQLPPDVGHRSDESDDTDDELFLEIDMEALRQRGKGSYSCPKAYQCKKGGVDKEGNLVIFDRNSSFAQHCNKHRKPWRCDIPGCPNPPKKRRFARRDDLERHKATVKHYVVT